MVVVDASAWIDYFRGVIRPETDALHQLLNRELVLVGDLILLEVLQGFKQDQDFKTALGALSALECRSMLGREAAIDCAGNYRELRSKGVTVRKRIDVIIASFCIRHDHALLHTDRDFDLMQRHIGLKVYSVPR